MHYLDYNEKINHGSPDFPIAFYHVSERHPRYHMPFHWHKEMEIIRIRSGFLKLFLDSQEILAQEGDMILIDDGVIHGGEPEHCVYECVVFDPSLLSHTDACKRYLRLMTRHQIQLCHYFPAAEPPITCQAASRQTDHSSALQVQAASRTASSAALMNAADRLCTALRYPHAGSELLTLGALYEFFGFLFEGEFYTQTVETDRRFFHKTDALKPVLEYISAHYAEPVTLEDLSKEAGMSPKYFCRCFRTFLHRTPMDYLNYYRIEQACYLLTREELSITETAYRCGFNDTSYFIKTFRKYTGTTPRKYTDRR